MDASTHRPEIDNVAYQIEIVAFIFTQEIQKSICLAATCAEVNIR
jgi:hypothetical protein